MSGFKYDGSYTTYQTTTSTNVRKNTQCSEVFQNSKDADLYTAANAYFKNKSIASIFKV